MTDLVLNDDHQQYLDLARDFSQKEIEPLAHQCDLSGEFPQQLIKKAWEVGLINAFLPESSGGAGLTIWDACIMAEEIGAACIGIGSIIWGCDLAATALSNAGSVQQKDHWLKPMQKQYTLGAYCFPHTGATDRITYSCQDDGSFILAGTAVVINAARSLWILVIAADRQNPRLSTAFVVPLDSLDRCQLTIGPDLPRLGMKAADLQIISFHNVKLQSEHVLGKSGNGTLVAAQMDACMAPVQAAYITGLMRSALEHSVRYARERQTMGQAIGNHQAVALMLADLAKDLEAARLMAWKAAWLFDQGNMNLNNSQIARIFALDAAMKGAVNAVQIFGGYGYCREYPVEKLMRDAKTMQVLIGNSAAAKIHLAQHLITSATAGIL